MVHLSGFADEVSVEFQGQLDFLKQNGVKFIELRFVDGVNIVNMKQGALQNAKSMLQEYGIGVSAIASPIGKIALDEPFEPHFEKFKLTVALAEYFGTKLIRIFSFYAPEGKSIDSCKDVVVARMKRMADHVAGTDIILVHENEAGIFGHSAQNCVDIAQGVDSKNLALAYDPANFVWGDDIADNVERCFPLMKPYVKHIHIKDWKLGSRNIGSLPGQGDAQIDMLIAELAKMKYEGFVSLEPHMNSGGQFGGETTPEQFKAALDNIRAMCDKHSLKYE